MDEKPLLSPWEDESRTHPDDAIKERLEKEGWQRAGKEYPFRTPFVSETMRFEKTRVLTDEQITEKYLNAYGMHGFTEVRIELSHDSDGTEDDEIVYVYMRKKEKT